MSDSMLICTVAEPGWRLQPPALDLRDLVPSLARLVHHLHQEDLADMNRSQVQFARLLAKMTRG